jgi:hypothetical protein
MPRSKRQRANRSSRRAEKRIRDIERRLNRLTGDVLSAVVLLLDEYAPADGQPIPEPKRKR